MGLTMI